VIYMHAKFEASSFNHSRDMEGQDPKILKVGYMTPLRPPLA